MRKPEPDVRILAHDVYLREYLTRVGHLNRKERRTAHGRQLVAEAEAAALRAKVEFLEHKLEAME